MNKKKIQNIFCEFLPYTYSQVSSLFILKARISLIEAFGGKTEILDSYKVHYFLSSFSIKYCLNIVVDPYYIKMQFNFSQKV